MCMKEEGRVVLVWAPIGPLSQSAQGEERKAIETQSRLLRIDAIGETLDKIEAF